MGATASIARVAALALSSGCLASCSSMYYSTMETLGWEKRDIMVDRVQDARDEQEAAKQQFLTALERFKEVATFEGGDLEAKYDSLKREYDRSASRAEAVRSRISSVEEVAEDLFAEWGQEIEQIQNSKLRASSEEIRQDAETRYRNMLAAMKKAEGTMGPVLTALNDHVLYLKHNLNARAVASLQGTLESIQNDVAALIADMEKSIAEANEFIASMERERAS